MFVLPLLVLGLLRVASASYPQVILQDGQPQGSMIRDALVKNGVIGDVLDDFEPTWALDVMYPKPSEMVDLGNDIPVKHVRHRPSLVIHSLFEYSYDTVDILNRNHTFAIALTDPDAKSRNDPKWSEMCHWLLINVTISARDALHADRFLPFKRENEMKEYKPPGPPPKTGAHRYVFVLLQGDMSNLSTPKERQHWGYGKPRHGVRDWAHENNLTVVGANFFVAHNKKQ